MIWGERFLLVFKMVFKMVFKSPAQGWWPIFERPTGGFPFGLSGFSPQTANQKLERA